MNIFHNPAKSVPETDEQIVAVSMRQIDIGGRRSHWPAQHVAAGLPISHVPNAGTGVGTK